MLLHGSRPPPRPSPAGGARSRRFSCWSIHNCEHLSQHLQNVSEVRHGTAWHYYEAGRHGRERAAKWALEIADLVSAQGGGNRHPAVDRLNPNGVDALSALGISVHGGEEVMEHARAVKCVDELKAMRRANH